MSDSLVKKLLVSFDELENCIELTKEVLASKEGVSEDIQVRVSQYTDIVKKQRKLAGDLTDFITKEDWHEVGRHVKIINGLSTMIRDDAQSILTHALELPELKPQELLT